MVPFIFYDFWEPFKIATSLVPPSPTLSFCCYTTDNLQMSNMPFYLVKLPKILENVQRDFFFHLSFNKQTLFEKGNLEEEVREN